MKQVASSTSGVAKSGGAPKQAAKSQQAALKQHEARIARAVGSFYDAGLALKEIRDGEIYRADGWETWESYCDERWGFSKQHCNRLIKASEYHDALPAEPKGSVWTETQVRELTRIPDKARAAEVAKQVVAKVEEGEKLTAKLIKAYVDRELTPKIPVPKDDMNGDPAEEQTGEEVAVRRIVAQSNEASLNEAGPKQASNAGVEPTEPSEEVLNAPRRGAVNPHIAKIKTAWDEAITAVGDLRSEAGAAYLPGGYTGHWRHNLLVAVDRASSALAECQQPIYELEARVARRDGNDSAPADQCMAALAARWRVSLESLDGVCGDMIALLDAGGLERSQAAALKFLANNLRLNNKPQAEWVRQLKAGRLDPVNEDDA